MRARVPRRTPDEWVPRHPDMVRLTGRHPFNVEPPLSLLMDQGLITPPALHIVRDHGAVPKIDWDTHTVSISGAVSNPLTLSMDEIAGMDTISFPCTVTCAGVVFFLVVPTTCVRAHALVCAMRAASWRFTAFSWVDGVGC